MITPPPRDEVTLYRNNSPSPLGQVTLLASIKDGRGVQPPLPLRVYGSYALVYVTAGRGTYADANGTALKIGAGDVILVFPELPHIYGPCAGETWDEFFVLFSGPAFEAWRRMGLLSLARPVIHLPEPGAWRDRLQALALPPGVAGEAARAGQVLDLLRILTELSLISSDPPSLASENIWLARACALLAEDIGGNRPLCELVRPLGLPYETFRKKFTHALGQPPARFRAQKRLAAAADLMQFTSLTNAQIAERLGFGDEFHFSKRFKRLRGETPTAFRRRVRG
jgi:AraC-like DNA-binding protein